MKGLLIAAIIVLLLILGGWIVIENRSDRTNIVIDKQEIKEDTAKALDKIEETADEVTREVDERIDFEEEPATP